MNSIRQLLFDIFNEMMHLNPNKQVPSSKEVQENAFNEIRKILQEIHASVNTLEEVLSLLGNKNKVSK